MRTRPDLVPRRIRRPGMFAGGDGSTLSLDFTSMSGLDSRFTFSRSSTATFINSSGLVQYADHNLFTNTAWLGSTLPTNWSLLFGTGTTTWNANGSVTMTAATSQRPAINHAAVTVAPGLPHTFGFLATSVSGSPQISQVISSNLTDTYAINGVTVSGTTVVQNNDVVSCTFTPSTTSVTPRIGPGSTGAMSNTSLTASRPQFNIGSSLQQYLQNTSTAAAYHAARFDYNPTTLAARGLLIEAGATNLCLNGSMAYTATAPTNWTRIVSGCTVASVNSTTFPEHKAWSISATASGQRDFLRQTISLAANTTYTVSVYLEAVTGTTADFAYMTSLPAGATSGTVVNPSAGRVTFTVTVGATAGTGNLQVGIGTATGTGVSADASVRFSHVQVEAGSGASSYIPTGSSTVQRATDSCSMTGTNFSSWYGSPTAFSMLFEGIAQISANYGRVLCLSSGANTTSGIPNLNLGLSAATSNRPFINAYIVSNNNIDTYAPAGAALTNGVPFKIGVRHQTSSHYITRGTSLGATNPYAGFAAGLANLYFGNTDGIMHRSVHYARLKFWPVALSNAQLDSFAT